jgi:hypothetical protein
MTRPADHEKHSLHFTLQSPGKWATSPGFTTSRSSILLHLKLFEHKARDLPSSAGMPYSSIRSRQPSCSETHLAYLWAPRVKIRIQYRFNHSCGHTAIGPIVHFPTPFPSSAEAATDPELLTRPTNLPIYCPFCSPNPPPGITPGSGVLAIFNSFLTNWTIIRPCAFSEMTPGFLDRFRPQDRSSIHMAWVPKACGEIEIIGGEDEVGRDGTTERGTLTIASSQWTERLSEAGEPGSRFAGMLSQLNSAVLSGERAGR